MGEGTNWFKIAFKSRRCTTGTLAAAATPTHMAATVTNSVLDTMARAPRMAPIGKSRGSMKELAKEAADGAVIDAGVGATVARDLRKMQDNRHILNLS